jgi:hypothetical protein
MNNEWCGTLHAQHADKDPQSTAQKERKRQRILTKVNTKRYTHAARAYGKLSTNRWKSAI